MVLCWTHSDTVRLCAYTLFFTVLFFAYSRVTSPPVVVSFDSSSIENQEVVSTGSSDATQTGLVEAPVSLDSATPDMNHSNHPKLALRFNPESITVNEALLSEIRAHAQSSEFRDAISGITVEFDATRTDPRGQVSGNTLILSTHIASDTEAMKVFVHELGHVVDILHLHQKSGVLGGTASDAFYATSWLDYKTKRPEAKITDFVSGYALSNKYEDFAETFAFYVFHNDEFLARTRSSDILRQKYAFMHDVVFSDGAFEGSSFSL